MRKKSNILIFIIITILIIITIASTIYLKYIQELINDNTFKNLGELTKQDAIKIENKLEEDIRILNSIANQITSGNITSETEMFNIYNENSGKDNFTRMAIMHEDGKTITNDGAVVDLSEDIDYFFSSNNVQISRSRKSKIDLQEINIYSKKINIKSKQLIIMLIVETDDYERLFANSIYNGNGYEYIIKSTGEIIANSAGHENTENIYEDLKQNTNSDNSKIENIEENIKRNINSQDIILVNGKKYYISYNNIEINDWNLLVITPGNIIAEELNYVLQLTTIIAIIVVIIIATILIYIVIANIKKEKELYKLAYIDPITKLGNYYYFIKEGQKAINNKSCYVIILDIEKFSSFTKRYGHNVGDQLIDQIGKIINQTLKDNNIICRFSKDLFGILILNEKNISKIAENLFNNLTNIEINNEKYRLYPILGIYKCKKEEKIVEAIDKATIAHDNIIGNYNKKYNIYDEKIESKILEEHQIEEVMEDALKNNEFEVYYQPKISLENEKMISAEALVRWKRNGETISPGKFIPLFEKNRFILKLDLYIFETVCKNLKRWKENLDFTQVISINVSKEHFNNINFIDKYVQIAKKYKIPTNQIELEITESASIDSNINLIEIMNKIKEKGFIISLDDFGTGYSSLNMLQDMPIDVLKIDKSFIDKIEVNDKKVDLVEYIIKMAKDLNIKTVAEGVENKNQVYYLKNKKCDIIQGYYYSKPLSINEFENYMKN